MEVLEHVARALAVSSAVELRTLVSHGLRWSGDASAQEPSVTWPLKRISAQVSQHVPQRDEVSAPAAVDLASSGFVKDAAGLTVSAALGHLVEDGTG